MPPRLILLLLLLPLLLLSGCAGPAITPLDAGIEDSRAIAMASCHQARASSDSARWAAIASMPEAQQGMAMMADAMARQAEAFTGKDPCAAGMGAFEARARIAESQNRAVTEVGGTALRVGGAVGGAVVAADAIKAVARAAGNKTTIEGDGNTYSNEQVISTSEQQVKGGDDSTVSATAPPVSGPDKHSETTTEMLAPESAPETEAAE